MVEFAFYTREEGNAITRDRGSLQKKIYCATHKEYVDAYMKARSATPERKAYMKVYLKAYQQTPERKAWKKAYQQTPKYKTHAREYMREYMREYNLRKKGEKC